MADEKKSGQVDKWFTKISDSVSEKIGGFVAFMFFLVALGALASLIVVHKWPEFGYLTVIVPVIAGVLAYYDRTIATVLFTLLILFAFIL
jgi:hypothetical protein